MSATWLRRPGTDAENPADETKTKTTTGRLFGLRDNIERNPGARQPGTAGSVDRCPLDEFVRT
jgi:hypothetical protein